MARDFFKNLPNTTTPLTAPRLNGLLDGDEAMGNVVVDSIRSKNIFSSQLELGAYDSSGNKSSSSANYRNASFVAVQPNTTYTFSINGVSQKYVLLYYTSARAFISQDASLNTGTFTTPNDCYFINIRCFSADFTSDYGSLKIQLEEGTTATSYSPYQELNNQEIYSTGEVKIGTWIDGKPLYREVVVLSSITVGSVVSATLESLGITNINNIFINVSKSFIINSSNETRPLIGAINTSNISYAYLTNTRLYRYCTDNNLNGTWTICLEYTKTTD